MIKDDIIFCQFRREQGRDYAIQVVKKIVGDTAITTDGFKVDIHTGIENNKKFGVRTWVVLTSRNKKEYLKIKEFADAKKWVKKITEFPEMLVRAYRTCNSSDVVDRREFFHELDSDPYKLLYAEKMGYIHANFRKPVWCGHPFALSGWFGCPRLLKGKPVSERRCQECSCFVNPRYGDYFKRLRLITGISVEKIGRYLDIKDYKELENGQRRASADEVERALELFCIKDWYFVDILKMLYTPKAERDLELDKLYRDTIQNKIHSQNEKKQNGHIRP